MVLPFNAGVYSNHARPIQPHPLFRRLMPRIGQPWFQWKIRPLFAIPPAFSFIPASHWHGVASRWDSSESVDKKKTFKYNLSKMSPFGWGIKERGLRRKLTFTLTRAARNPLQRKKLDTSKTEAAAFNHKITPACLEDRRFPDLLPCESIWGQICLLRPS